MKKILVTGGLGYIGSHTVVELEKNGFEAIVVDNLSNSEDFVLGRLNEICGRDITFYNSDVRDSDALINIINKHQITGVIHFAAFKAVGESVKKPLMYYDNNIGGLVSLLYAMEKTGVQDLVFSSSCTVYGQPDQSPVDELSPIKKAGSPYGHTKQIGEEIIMNCAFVRSVLLRYFNPIGAHESAKIGELPKGVPNNLVPFITQTAAGIREKVTVFGEDYNTPDGTCIRDYIHVCDLALAHVKALKFLEENPETTHEIFNIGTGNGYSVLEIVKTFEQVNNIKLNYEMGPRREGDVEQVWASTQKAEKSLRWKAELGLDTMLESAWKWQQTL